MKDSAPAMSTATATQIKRRQSRERFANVRERSRTAGAPRDDETPFARDSAATSRQLDASAAWHGTPELAGPQAPKSVRELVADSKTLPSFCGDKEKTTHDPGSRAVPAGDVDRLKTELANIDHHATLMRAPLP